MKRSASQPKPISISPEVAARCDGPKQFEKFDNLFRAVIAVPKAEIDKEEAKWRRSREAAKSDRNQSHLGSKRKPDASSPLPRGGAGRPLAKPPTPSLKKPHR
jgi:hypothetical protein